MSESNIVTNQQPGLSLESAKNETYVFPMSSAQRRLWFLDQLHPNTAAYNLPIAMRIEGRLEKSLLEKSLQQIVSRHEVLRTTFGEVNSEPVQIVSSSAQFTLGIIDLTACPKASVENKVEHLIGEDVRHVFDLRKGPLFRGTLYVLPANEHALLLNMHHIVADGWSFTVILRELGAIYESLSTGARPNLPELSIQYADYAQWQQESSSGDDFDSKLSFWKSALEDSPRILDLPIAKARPRMPSLQGSTASLLIPEKLSCEVKELSRLRGSTPFVTLLACFKILLYRYSNQQDIVVGTPVANRNLPELEDLVGCFVNTAVYRTQLSGDLCFNDVVSKVREWSLQSLPYQDVPFEKLVEELQPERTLDRSPLFQTYFIYQRAFIQPINLSEVTFKPFRTDRKGSQTDLTLFIVEREEGLRLACEYRIDLFDSPAIDRLLGHYRALLQNCVSNPFTPIKELAMLPASERKQIVEDWNTTEAWYPRDKCAHQLFEEQVERTPEAAAIEFDGQVLTYRQLNDRANRAAESLVASGIRPDDLVGLCVERSFETVIGIFAILKAGGAYVPLDPTFPTERLLFMIRDARVSIVLSHKRLLDTLGLDVVKAVYLDEELPVRNSRAKDYSPTESSPKNLAYVNYTSGSTGMPKGVCIQHDSLVNYTQSVLDVLPKDRALHFANVSTIAADLGNTCIFPPLLSGGCTHVVKYDVLTSAERFRDYAKQFSIDVLKIVPSHLSALLGIEDNAYVLPRELLIVGGEALSWDLVERVEKSGRQCRIINEYGPTETTVGSTTAVVRLANKSDFPAVPIGRPIANTSIYILNEQLEPAPVDARGEIYIGGVGVARGYLNRPDLTAERFVRNPFSVDGDARLYKTGDLARYRASGVIEYLGRADNQVKIRGFRLELGEIEAMIKQFSDVDETVAQMVDDGTHADKLLVAYVVSGSKSKIDSVELRSFLREKLPDYAIPSAFVQIGYIPLTGNGKIDFKELPIPAAKLSSDSDHSEVPKTETEKLLMKIWEEIFGVDNIGIHDNFFELGGHSLLAIRMFAAVEKRFGKSPPLAMLFEAGTIKKLAEAIADSLWEGTEPSLVPIQPNGTRPPLFCFHAGGGNVLFYNDLAKYMGNEQPIYGLQARRIGNRQVAHETVEEMVEFYLSEITKLQPSGPYYLCGSSFGGVLAVEAAQILRRAGEEIGMVALFDTNGPGYPKLLKETTPLRQKWFTLLRRLQHHSESLAVLNFYERSTYVKSKFKKLKLKYKRKARKFYIRGLQAFNSELREGKELPRKYLQREDKIGTAGRRYRHKQYPGTITLFRAEKQPLGIVPDQTLGWSGIASELQIHEVPGHHGSIVDEPYVRNLSKVLRACLESLEKPAATPGQFRLSERTANGKDFREKGSRVIRGESVAMITE